MILGGTVAELKARMSAAEFGRWCKYFEKFGRITPIRMYDSGPALLAMRIDHALGGQSKIEDFLPYKGEAEKVASVDDIVKSFGGVKMRG